MCVLHASRLPGIQPGVRMHPLAGFHPKLYQTFPGWRKTYSDLGQCGAGMNVIEESRKHTIKYVMSKCVDTDRRTLSQFVCSHQLYIEVLAL